MNTKTSMIEVNDDNGYLVPIKQDDCPIGVNAEVYINEGKSCDSCRHYRKLKSKHAGKPLMIYCGYPAIC